MLIFRLREAAAFGRGGGALEEVLVFSSSDTVLGQSMHLATDFTIAASHAHTFKCVLPVWWWEPTCNRKGTVVGAYVQQQRMERDGQTIC